MLCVSGGALLADGMIVPVRPDIRVRGHWAVNYHHVKMTVRDQVASVSIDQEFVNTGKGMIEVEYLFPVPPGAAIDSMTLIVNGQEFAAKLMKADEARRIYESIVRKKKDPALLEYVGFGLYRTKAFPLEPGKPVKVLVSYKYVCKKDSGVVEVWYPLNTEKFSARPIKDVKVTVDIKEKSDITSVYSPTHDLTVDRKGPRHVIATYHVKDQTPASDLQIFYKAANDKVGATLLTHRREGQADGYYMLLVSPNPRTDKTKIVPKDVVIVLDRSGSMSGEKIEQAKESARFVLNHLNEGDRFNVISYSDDVEAFFDGLVKPDKAKLAEAMDRIDRIEARGGTNIHDALQKAMGHWKVFGVQTKEQAARPKYVIFLTDGKATVGKKDEKSILAGTKQANAANARLFAFGVGYNVNVRLLDKLVLANGGKSDYVKPKENIEAKVSSLYAKIKNPVMTNLKVAIENVKLKNFYPREMGDLFDGDQIVMVGRYDAGGTEKIARIWNGRIRTQLIVSGMYQGKERAFEYPVEVRLVGTDSRFAFVEQIWATRRVGYLMDQVQLNGESKEIIDEIVTLSTEYGIMTPYTSFLADESTNLADARVVHARALREMDQLRSDVSGARGQRAASSRGKLNYSMRAPARSAPTEAGKQAGVKMFGNVFQDAYEAGEVETVSNVRQVANQALYKRGNVWQAANARHIDLKKDADKIQTIERFSDEYFKLSAANTVEENQIFASQQTGEELVISLRGQVYRIK